MKVRVLGCSGAIAKDCRTTSFLIDDNILIDAGTGVGDLTLDEMRQVDHVFLTHSHLDHIAALPLMLDAVSSLRQTPLQVHALASTITALQTHIFNNVIWPDFSVIPSVAAPFLQYQPFFIGESRTIKGVEIEVLPAHHTVPAVGFAARGCTGWWVFTGDTECNPHFWQRINSMSVAYLVIETAFSNRESELARRSLHLSPSTLAHELAHIAPSSQYPIYITHTKPSETGLIMDEICEFAHLTPGGIGHSHRIQWLCAGQVMEV
ncbi:MAG: 3',5'-cyclic-nucleotide phosphodiesterase [Acidovorax sp.]|uniref:3',5'-cyclic-nucleotide phosphodiesterase n=1 Tax=Acidovorax sp. TaxID=1872122 RepID=UPI00391DD900